MCEVACRVMSVNQRGSQISPRVPLQKGRAFGAVFRFVAQRPDKPFLAPGQLLQEKLEADLPEILGPEQEGIEHGQLVMVQGAVAAVDFQNGRRGLRAPTIVPQEPEDEVGQVMQAEIGQAVIKIHQHGPAVRADEDVARGKIMMADDPLAGFPPAEIPVGQD